MTIMIVAFTPTEIMFVSDSFRYYLKEGTTEDVLNHKLEINHTNLKDHIESYETNCPKIHEGLICGGDGRFSDIITKDKNTPEQIIERLKQKGKLNAYWSCHIGELGKLTSIIYKNGEIETKEQTTDNIWFDSFAPEIKEIFFKKYITQFYIATTQEKIKIIHEFFKEITTLFDGLAGGTPQIAILNEKGFNYITTQNFTTYSLNWMPEKMETTSAIEMSWSQTTWTDILDLQFDCEATMLLFGSVYCRVGDPNGAGLNIKIRDENNNDVPCTYGYFYTGGLLRACYGSHFVLILQKGIHHVKISIASNTSGVLVYAYDRRLTLMKGFYQGGTA